jgi:predicted nicotinamide N-methyase
MDPAAFVRRNTVIAAPPLVPEIRLHLAAEVTPIWQATEESLARDGLPPPFWAFAWAGGQALARYLLDRPETVAGRDVLDFGSGSGLVAIAAAKAGAASVRAAEIDPFAAAAIAANAALNNVEIG